MLYHRSLAELCAWAIALCAVSCVSLASCTDFGVESLIPVTPGARRALLKVLPDGSTAVTSLAVIRCGMEYSQARHPSPDFTIRMSKLVNGCTTTRRSTIPMDCWAPSDPLFDCMTQTNGMLWCSTLRYYGGGSCCCTVWDCGWTDWVAIWQGNEKCGWSDHTTEYLEDIDCCSRAEVSTGFPVVKGRTYCDITITAGGSAANYTLYDDSIIRVGSTEYSLLQLVTGPFEGTYLRSACGQTDVIWPVLPEDIFANPGLTVDTCNVLPHDFNLCAQSSRLIPVIRDHERVITNVPRIYYIEMVAPASGIKVELISPSLATYLPNSCSCSAYNDYVCSSSCSDGWVYLAEDPNLLLRCQSSQILIPSTSRAIARAMNFTCQMSLAPLVANFSNPFIFDIGTANINASANWLPGCGVSTLNECLYRMSDDARFTSWWIIGAACGAAALIVIIIIIVCCCRARAGTARSSTNISFGNGFLGTAGRGVPEAIPALLLMSIIAAAVRQTDAFAILPVNSTHSLWAIQPAHESVSGCTVTFIDTGLTVSLTPAGLAYMEIPLASASTNLRACCWKGSRNICVPGFSMSSLDPLSQCTMMSPLPCFLPQGTGLWNQLLLKGWYSRWYDLLGAAGLICFVVGVVYIFVACLCGRGRLYPCCVGPKRARVSGSD